MTRRLGWPGIACVSGAVLVVLVLTGAGGAGRFALAVWFLLGCTGMSIVPALGIAALRVELLVGVTTGVAIDTLIGVALAASGQLTVVNALLALEGVCLAGAALNITCRQRGLQ
jgi:hypothetical protein